MKKNLNITLGHKRKYRRSKPSLLRKLVLLFSILVVVSYLFWAMGMVNEQTRTKQALIDISQIEHAARLFRADHDRCPNDIDELVNPPGKSQYLLYNRDPWGSPYRLTCPARRDPGGVSVISGGPDGSFDGYDTISSL